MDYLLGLKEYLDEKYALSVFDYALESKQPWELHMHDHRTVTAQLRDNTRYDIILNIEGRGEEVVPKVQVKFLYRSEFKTSVLPLLGSDKKIKDRAMAPILAPGKRFFVKNKSLFPLMKEKQVLFFTLLEGEIIRGIITDFSRYDITIHLKGGVPITLLRHSLFDLRNKKGRCFMKSFQETRRDWEKSDLYVKKV